MQPSSSLPTAWQATLPAIAWLLGLAGLQQLRVLPTVLTLAGLALLGLIALALAFICRRRRLLALLALCFAISVLAFAQAAWRAQLRLDEALPAAWEGRDLLLQGRVASLPTAVQGIGGAPGWRFEFELAAGLDPQSGQALSAQLPRRLLLSWYAAPEQAPPALQAGERWQLLARLKQPHGLMNPHAFDYELWLFEQDLRATGVVRDAQTRAPAKNKRLQAAPWWSLDSWRQRLRQALQAQVSDPAVAGILAALSLGDQAAISKADWGLFRDTGVAHLLSVSGLHVTMFAWGMQGLFGWLWRRSARVCLRLPAVTAARWAGVLAALSYALFSGWGVPAQRTVWMLLSVAVLRSLGLRWPWSLILLAAAVVVTAIDPFAISQAGFWLSFFAVGLLMASGSDGGEQTAAGGWRAQLKAGLHSQWVATLGLTPLSLLFFQQISVVGLLANLLAIPLVSFVIAPLSLAGALLPSLWWLAEGCVRGLMAYLHGLAQLPWAVWTLPVAPLWAQAAGLCAGALLVLPLPWRLRLLGLPMALPLLWPAPWQPAQGDFELLAADIGQGNAVLVRTATHSLLYDSGPQFAPGIDAGQRVLLPLLRALGVARLDRLMLSHRDSDHVGGAASLLAGMPIGLLHSSLEPEHGLLREASARGVLLQACTQGQAWVWDGVAFELLHPRAEHYVQGLKSNAMSCVLRLRSLASGKTALLTGDLEAAQELELVQQLGPQALRSTVLLVPHHGSKTSSSAEFLAAVAPQVAVAQMGYRNRFGHPAPGVAARYQAQGIALLRSDECGAWRWRSEAAPTSWPVYLGECQRELGLRFWHWRPAPVSAEMGPWPDGDVGLRD
ncbi:hypothetical protein AT984_05295 [Paucibacter sp. KCTC 42545]|nr:hypothetical protein AT984_05295 [Paucibacter sp. KCTC 42545]